MLSCRTPDRRGAEVRAGKLADRENPLPSKPLDHAGKTAAIIGGGVIGASWAALFAANGMKVVISDPDPEIASKATAIIEAALVALGHESFDVARQVSFERDNTRAVAQAFIVQECGPERLGFKQGLWEVIEAAAPNEALLCSSSSGIPASLQQTEMRDQTRLVIGRPFNPPHLIPLVQVAPAPTTNPEITERVVAFYKAMGKVTRVIRKEVPGIVANRLRAVIFRECVSLVSAGVVTINELNNILTTAPELRRATSGPFQSLHLGGQSVPPHFAEHLGPPMARLWATLGAPCFDQATGALIARQAAQSSVAGSSTQPGEIRDAKQVAVINALADIQANA